MTTNSPKRPKFNNDAIVTSFVVGFVLGFALVILIASSSGLKDPPEDRYTVQELTDAIATREANYTERAQELEAAK